MTTGLLSLRRCSGTIKFKDGDDKNFAVDDTAEDSVKYKVYRSDGRAMCSWGAVVERKGLRVGDAVMFIPAVEDNKSLVVVHNLSS